MANPEQVLRLWSEIGKYFQVFELFFKFLYEDQKVYKEFVIKMLVKHAGEKKTS